MILMIFQILLKILKHIHHAVNHCSKYTKREDFEADDMCVEATVFNLMQIGELAKSSLSEIPTGPRSMRTLLSILKEK